jgi:hypothetical protein
METPTAEQIIAQAKETVLSWYAEPGLVPGPAFFEAMQGLQEMLSETDDQFCAELVALTSEDPARG